MVRAKVGRKVIRRYKRRKPVRPKGRVIRKRIPRSPPPRTVRKRTKEVRKGRIGTKQNPLRQSDIIGFRGKSTKPTKPRIRKPVIIHHIGKRRKAPTPRTRRAIRRSVYLRRKARATKIRRLRSVAKKLKKR